MGNRITRNPKNNTQPNHPNHNQTQPKARGRFPIKLTVFPLYEGETGEKKRLRTNLGPEFVAKFVSGAVHERSASEAKRERLRSSKL